MLSELGISFSSNSILLGIASFFAFSIVLYFARTAAHRAIYSLSRVVGNGLRLGATSLVQAQEQLRLRNREVLLSAGREAAERMIDREFERIDTVVARDVSAIPGLDRDIRESLTKLEEDYSASTEVPPEPPGWIGVVDAVSQIKGKADGTVQSILEQIHGSLVRAQDQAIEQYRSAVQSRHEHLKEMMPEWRKLQTAAANVSKNVHKLLERTKVMDRYMEEYEQIQNKTDKAVRMLSTSSLHQFIISAFVLIIAFGGAAINFHLIARPMAEMVGGNSSIGGFKTSDIAALVIILVEVSIGIFMMESMRITRLFPMIGALPDKVRVRMIYITFGILLSLASVEAGLAYMREVLLQDSLATNSLLRGASGEALTSEFMWITTVAQMGMGFILPFALVFAAIPLENFVFSTRTVTGIVAGAILRGTSVFMRVVGNGLRYGGDLLINVYDMIIFLPLWIEEHTKKSGPRMPSKKQAQAGSGKTSAPGGTPTPAAQP